MKFPSMVVGSKTFIPSLETNQRKEGITKDQCLLINMAFWWPAV